MRRFLTALAIWLAAAIPAAAQQTEIETVIADQFERFRADDFAAAKACASNADTIFSDCLSHTVPNAGGSSNDDPHGGVSRLENRIT